VKNLRANRKPLLSSVLSFSVLFLPASELAARTLKDQWYIGLGGTGAWLQPNPEEPRNNTEEAIGAGGTFMLGRDLDERSSIQVQGFALGEATLTDENTATYTAGDASVLYRFYDSRDNQLIRSGFGTAIYGRFALGFMSRESDTELERGSQVYFGLGAGAEVFVTNNIAFRAEAFYHDTDAVSATLALVFRFGGSLNRAGRLPTTLTGAQDLPASTTRPAATASATVPKATAPQQELALQEAPSAPATSSSQSVNDTDGDGIADANDACSNSTVGFPVRADGCPLFDGVLSGIRFLADSAELAPGSDVQLNFLADLLLNKHPNARIELHAHTDDKGDLRQQSILTRARLRTLGTYLVQQGLRTNRMVLRSFGGSRPLYDNGTQEGREANNRIEVLERPR